MVIGSHNSWSFGKTKWYIPAFICRCQNKNIKDQYFYGVRVFDLRLRSNGLYLKPAHGAAFFKVDYESDLKWLNQKSGVKVRVILEYNAKPRDYDYAVKEFRTTCSYLEDTYTNIYFFGGEMKYNWKKIYQFKNPDIPLVDRYSSTTNFFKWNWLRQIDDWWPWLYAKLMNKKNYKKFKNSDSVLFIDFIQYIYGN